MNLTAPFRGCRYSILKNVLGGDILLSGEFMRLKDENCEYLECEKKWVFALLIFVGGYFGGFTYNARGGVFCNAQTANFVLFGLAVSKAEWARAVYYFIPMTAYVLGAFVSETVAYSIKKYRLIRWDTLLIGIEMAAVVILALIPDSAPYQITHVAVNFICSMQYNTFRQAQGIPVSTTFCTNHIRQVGVYAALSLRHPQEKAYRDRMCFHILLIISFVAGVIAAAMLSTRFGGHALFGALVPLTAIFADFLYADLRTEKGRIGEKPHGH